MFWVLFESYVLCLFQHIRRYFLSADLRSCLTNWCVYISQRYCTFIAIPIVTSPKVEHIADLMCAERRLLSERKKFAANKLATWCLEILGLCNSYLTMSIWLSRQQIDAYWVAKAFTLLSSRGMHKNWQPTQLHQLIAEAFIWNNEY